MAAVTIDTTDDLDRNRYRCPRGHVDWEHVNGHFWCSSCARHAWPVDPAFDELHDAKTRARLPRDAIEFVG